MDDLFERIIARDVPSSVVYEDEDVFAFLDIRPVQKGHTLVVPKKKFVNLFDGDPVVLGKMMQAAQKIARAQKSALGADGVNIIMNNIVGQEVPHAHLHVIPRFEGDGALSATHSAPYEENEAEECAEKIQTAIETAGA